MSLHVSNPVYERVDLHYERLGRAQQKVAAWLRNNVHRAVFMSLKEIALAAEVGDATVHRMCTELGYNGFQQLKKDLQEDEYTLRTLRRLEKSQEAPPSSWMKKALEVELLNFQQTFTATLEQSLDQAARLIWEARRIYIVGWRMTSSVAHSLYYQLNFVFGNVIAVPSATVITEHLAFMEKGDVLIAMQYPRYSSLITKMVEEAKQKSVSCILFTDSPLSPSYGICDTALIARMESPGFLDSYVSPLLISQMLLQVIAHQHPEYVKEQLRKQEQLFHTFGTFRT
jgi:DNA-binding MurR/RpiR family transcriptional regulator